MYIEDSEITSYPFMFELMLSFFKVNMQLGEENYYLSLEDYTCVDICELVEPRGKYASMDENLTVIDSYGQPVTGRVCSCGAGWSRLGEELECFDC